MTNTKKYCCNRMKEEVEHKCELHKDRFECPDCLISYDERVDEYGIIIHDGGTSYIPIKYCPWCGKKLPESKEELWLKLLKDMGFEEPYDDYDKIPDDFKTGEWYRKMSKK